MLVVEEGRRSAERELRAEWGRWIEQRQHDAFATLTFERPATPEQARRQFARHERDLARRAGCWVGWVYACERGAAGLVHVHALLDADRRLSVEEMQGAWECGLAHVVPYDPQRGAAYYVSKVVADPEGECEFSKL